PVEVDRPRLHHLDLDQRPDHDLVAERAQPAGELLVPPLGPGQDDRAASRTSSSPSATGSSPDRRSTQRPSSSAIRATRVDPSWCAATGARHPPPTAAT